MQPTVLGLIVLPLCLCCLGSPMRLMQLALLTSIFEAGAALVIGGGLGIPVAMLPGLLFIASVALQYMLGMRYPGERYVLWVATPLVLLLGYALVSAALLPDAFQGEVLVWPQKPHPLGQDAPTPLAPDGSGRNQCMYLSMNVILTLAGALFVSRRAIPYRQIVGVYLLGGYAVVVLSAWQLASRLTGLFFPSDIFYSNPGFTLMIDNLGGVPRINATFAEASALANYMSGVVFCTLWLSVRGHQIMAPRLLFVLSLFTVLASTSTTGIATVVLGVPALLLLAGGTTGRAKLGRVWGTLGAMAAAALLIIVPLLILMPQLGDMVAKVADITLSKGSSDSYAERSAHDADAFTAMLDTYGLGVGWGSFRSSSLLPGLLANSGMIGVALILWFGLRTRWLVGRTGPATPGAGKVHEGRIAVDGFGAALCGQLVAAFMAAPTLTSVSFFLQLACLIGAAARIHLDRQGFAATGPRQPRCMSGDARLGISHVAGPA